MSYEGYEQCICENGHYFERDCYNDEMKCPVCGGIAGYDGGNSPYETEEKKLGIIQ